MKLPKIIRLIILPINTAIILLIYIDVILPSDILSKDHFETVYSLKISNKGKFKSFNNQKHYIECKSGVKLQLESIPDIFYKFEKGHEMNLNKTLLFNKYMSIEMKGFNQKYYVNPFLKWPLITFFSVIFILNIITFFYKPNQIDSSKKGFLLVSTLFLWVVFFNFIYSSIVR